MLKGDYCIILYCFSDMLNISWLKNINKSKNRALHKYRTVVDIRLQAVSSGFCQASVLAV